MKMRLLAVAILLPLAKAHESESGVFGSCYHNHSEVEIRTGRYARSAADDWEPMKFDVFYDDSILNLAENLHEMLRDIITEVRRDFSSFLSVRKLTKKIVETGGCDWKKSTTVETEGNFAIFVRQSRDQEISDDACNKPNSTTLAFAAACQREKDFLRPIAGKIVFCRKQIAGLDAISREKWKGVTKHELLHALIFNPALFENFLDNGKKITRKSEDKKEYKIVEGVVEMHTIEWKTAKGTSKREVAMIVTPNVVAAAREYFGCPDLKGVQLEDQGGGGTKGSHWEKRILEEEMMSGVVTQKTQFSNITLALMKDSGWYRINASFTPDHMLWGKGAGCKFVQSSCYEAVTQGIAPFCNDADKKSCSQDRKARVLCGKRNFTGLDEKKSGDYHYFSRNSEMGIVQIADYCPYNIVYNDNADSKSGIKEDTRCTHADKVASKPEFLEVFSETARCYDIIGKIEVSTATSGRRTDRPNGCFETLCSNGTLQVKPHNSPWFKCYKAGQIIHIDRDFDGGRLTFDIMCPDCASICEQPPTSGFKCAPGREPPGHVGDSATGYRIISALVAVLIYSAYLQI